MSRYQALLKLLKHGELMLSEIYEIMGGSRTSCQLALGQALQHKRVYRDWVGLDEKYFLAGR